MQVLLNGSPREIEDNVTVAELLGRLGMEPVRVAVELNEQIVPRGEFARTPVRQGDRMEIVTFVGGGWC